MRPTTFFFIYILGIYLAILYNKNKCSFVIQKNGNGFLFKHLFFGLSNNYFMVYFFKEVVKYNIKQMEIQITI